MTLALPVTIGGRGGEGGAGGGVSVTSNAVIETFGDNSAGIMAQSIGGGGERNGGMALGASTSLALSVGGSGSAGGTASRCLGDQYANDPDRRDDFQWHCRPVARRWRRQWPVRR